MRLAFRNLLLHRSKTLIIGIIMAVGVMIMVAGNSMVDTASQGIKRAFIDNFTGNLMISGLSEYKNSLFGVQAPGGIEENPVIPEAGLVMDFLDKNDDVRAFTPKISGFSLIKSPKQKNKDAASFSFLFGIDPLSFQKTFSGIILEEGQFPAPGEKGIVLPLDKKKTIKERLGVEIAVGDTLRLIGLSNAGPKIREIPLSGFFRYELENEGASGFSYVDAQTLRSLKGMNLSQSEDIQLEKEKTELLQAVDQSSLDDLFTDDSFTGLEKAESGQAAELKITRKKMDKRQINLDPRKASWEFIAIQLNSPLRAPFFRRRLRNFLNENGIQAQVMDWKDAADPFSSSVDVIRILINGAVFLVALIALIIVINTLVISVMERTAEIGTMRALGAQKGFVRRLFFFEMLLISLIFGTAGLLLGVLAIKIIALFQIEAVNPLVEIIFAGPVLDPLITPQNLLFALATAALIAIMANLYPIYLALRVQPVEAMREE